MFETHPTIDVDQYADTIKTSILKDGKVETYQCMEEIDELQNVDSVVVKVTAICVSINWNDIRSLSDRATIIKGMYLALMENAKCKDIFSMGDKIMAIFDTPYKKNIDAVLDSVAKLNAMFSLVDKLYTKSSLSGISHGIGMSYGKALLTKINNEERPEYNWGGEALELALKLSEIEQSKDYIVRASYTIFNNLKEDYQKLFEKVGFDDYYGANPVNIALNKWIIANI